jgi:DNA-binding transcriptional MerR regulator
MPQRRRPDHEGASQGDGALHSIGDVARLIKVSRRTIRLWKSERLVSPRRTPGGNRLYSREDLARLRAIARPRREERLNAAAIRRELGPVAPRRGAEGEPDEVDRAALGQRLRALRAAQGLSLATVAARVGLSIFFLSAVERGLANISVGSLFKLADAYGTTVPGLGPDYHPGGGSLLHPAPSLVEPGCDRGDVAFD